MRSPLYLNPAGVELLCITVCVHINIFTLNVFSFLNSVAMGVKHQHFLADSRGCKREALDLLVYKPCSLVLTCKQNSRVCGNTKAAQRWSLVDSRPKLQKGGRYRHSILI